MCYLKKISDFDLTLIDIIQDQIDQISE